MFYNEGKIEEIHIQKCKKRPHKVNYRENIRIHTDISHYGTDIIYYHISLFSHISVYVSTRLGFPNQIVVSRWKWIMSSRRWSSQGVRSNTPHCWFKRRLHQLLYLPRGDEGDALNKWTSVWTVLWIHQLSRLVRESCLTWSEPDTRDAKHILNIVVVEIVQLVI